AEITLLENNIIIYKFAQDLHFFVTGSDDENEIVLASVLQGFFDAVTLLLRNNVDKREALENLDLILLCLDEIVDGGMILETNGPLIAEKVTSHTIDADSSLSEQQKYGAAVVGCVAPKLRIEGVFECPTLTLVITYNHFCFLKLLPVSTCSVCLVSVLHGWWVFSL
ncbi:coatomer subunit zeta-2-like protein, partial [Trifolium pratense]